MRYNYIVKFQILMPSHPENVSSDPADIMRSCLMRLTQLPRSLECLIGFIHPNPISSDPEPIVLRVAGTGFDCALFDPDRFQPRQRGVGL